jgi:hypothetical protein
MQSSQIEPFVDNWAYLKAELSWLDRLLMLAVARQKKDIKTVDRLAQNRADRVSSHWWKGVITFEGEIAYDDQLPNRSLQKAAKVNYQQQIESRIQVSLERGCKLGLPWLRDRLNLSTFEKNLILISLAPEVNQRYSRLYSYLQGNPNQTDLPRVDLVLRLLCRNDVEWRSARNLLTSTSSLLQYGLLEVFADQLEPLLTRSLKLPDFLVNYLLADDPEPDTLEAYLQSSQLLPDRTTVQPLLQRLNCWQPTTKNQSSSWSNLVLPEPLLATLHHVCDRVQFQETVDEQWGFQTDGATVSTGTIALLSGATGTGKTHAAKAIAQTLETSLHWVDLAQIEPQHYAVLLQEIAAQNPIVLLLKSAHLCLGRHSALSQAQLQQFLDQRRNQSTITLLSIHPSATIRPHWRPQIRHVLNFPEPDQFARLRLWQQAFPVEVPMAPDLDFTDLATRFRLTGGAIRTIARDAAFYAAAESPQTSIDMRHILQAIEAYQPRTARNRVSSKKPGF